METPAFWFEQAIISFVATLGFVMLFNVPRRALLPCTLIGVVAHLLRLLLPELGLSENAATFFGALFVGTVGAWPARWLNLPMLVFAITGIIALIPGISAFEALVHFSYGNIPTGLQSLVRAGFGVGAIAAGIGAGRILTDRQWGMD
jgi:uncharacterized membrane protein YjjB (DUF3815 family)